MYYDVKIINVHDMKPQPISRLAMKKIGHLGRADMKVL
jgi:hypothetical protein